MTHPIKRTDLWFELGLRDLAGDHARAKLGALWPVIGAALWISIIYIFLGPSIGENRQDYLPYLTIGVVCYNFISGVIVNGVGALLRFKGPLLNVPISLAVFPWRITVTVAATTLLQIPFIICAMVWSNVSLTLTFLWVFPAIIIYLLQGAALSSLLSVLGVIIGDVRYMITTIMRMFMFATPIFWFPGNQGLRVLLSDLNPLTHFIAIVREPLLYGTFPAWSWIIVMVILSVTTIAAKLSFRIGRNNILRHL